MAATASAPAADAAVSAAAAANAALLRENLAGVPDVPASFITNSYLADLTAGVRSRPIPWENYQQANLITPAELGLVKEYDKLTTETAKIASIQQNGSAYVKLFLTLLQKLVRVDTIQYILVLVDDMLAEKEERAQLFLALTNKESGWPYSPLVNCLRKDDEYVPLQAAKILSFLICTSKSVPPSEVLDEFFSWLVTLLQSKNPGQVDLAVQLLQNQLKIIPGRFKFYETNGGISALLDILKSSPSPQMQYQVGFCFWLLSFEKPIATNLNRKYNVIPVLIDVAKAAMKEKVIRVIIATFKNFVVQAPEANMGAMLTGKLLPFCENLAGRKWSDTEIMDDITFLKEQLQNNFQSLSTFDEYSSEVRSGRLEWSPPHQSEQFWKNNASKLNDSDYELIRILSKLLGATSSNLVLAVACHDLGQYVKYCPAGKKFLQTIGAKTRVMELMTHEDPDVRYQALLAVQKFMSSAWEF